MKKRMADLRNRKQFDNEDEQGADENIADVNNGAAPAVNVSADPNDVTEGDAIGQAAPAMPLNTTEPSTEPPLPLPCSTTNTTTTATSTAPSTLATPSTSRSKPQQTQA